jgi:TonB dependent receptor
VVRDQDTARVGLRYSPTPRSTFLLSYIYNDLHEDAEESEPFDPSTTLTSNITANAAGDQVEAQYIYQQDWFNVTAGFGYSEVDRTTDGSLVFTNISPPIPLFEIPTSSTAEIQHPHGYVYANVNFPQPVTWTLGASYDNYEEEPLDETSFNPKFGVQWHVTDRLRLRAAAFKVLKPALVNNRTIEPTQIAGFNQFFDDINATKTTRYGVGFDWQLTRDVSIGAEATLRDLDEPLFISSASGEDGVLFEDRDEQYHNLYLYWTPMKRLGVKTEFVYDLFENEIGPSTDPNVGGDLPKQVETLSVPIGVTYFDTTGLFAAVGATFVHQDVERFGSTTPGQGNDGFFVVDTAVGYRLPKRYGVVSLGVKNVFDIEFNYQDDSYREFRTEPSTGPYFPDRTLLFRITVNL